MLPKQTKERLSKMAWLLRNLPAERKVMIGGPKGVPKRFDMGRWYQCGTTACAVGYAAQYPWFIERGLTLGMGELPIYQGRIGLAAVAIFFSLDYNDAFFLFTLQGNQRTVRLRIERFVRDGGRKAA